MGKSKTKTPFKEKADDLSKNHGTTRRYRVRKQEEQEKKQELQQYLKETDANKS